MGALDFALDSGFAPRILSCVPVCHLGLILVWRLPFCLGSRFGASDQYWCGALDFVLSFGFASQVLSCVLVRHLGSILIWRLGFFLVFQSSTFVQYWSTTRCVNYVIWRK